MQEKLKKIKQKPVFQKHGEKIRFVLVGGFNTALDFVIYGLLANIIGLPQVVASIISTSICIAVSFYLNFTFVWKSEKSIKNTIIGFLVVSLFSAWVVQSIAIKATLFIAGNPENNGFINLVAKAVGSIAGMVTNYFGYKIVFKKKI